MISRGFFYKSSRSGNGHNLVNQEATSLHTLQKEVLGQKI